MKKKLLFIIQPLVVILLVALIRLVPHIPNVTPIAAMALFGGVYLPKKYALLLPLSAMILSDIFLGFSLITLFVYASFLLTGGIGMWLKSHKKIGFILGASILSSILFFFITNFGVWIIWDFYPKTISGLLACFAAGIPFFRNTLLGDVGYVVVFFGGYEVLQKVFATSYSKK